MSDIETFSFKAKELSIFEPFDMPWEACMESGGFRQVYDCITALNRKYYGDEGFREDCGRIITDFTFDEACMAISRKYEDCEEIDPDTEDFSLLKNMMVVGIVEKYNFRSLNQMINSMEKLFNGNYDPSMFLYNVSNIHFEDDFVWNCLSLQAPSLISDAFGIEPNRDACWKAIKKVENYNSWMPKAILDTFTNRDFVNLLIVKNMEDKYKIEIARILNTAYARQDNCTKNSVRLLNDVLGLYLKGI